MEMLCLIVCLFAWESLHPPEPEPPLLGTDVCVWLGMKHKYYAYATVDTAHVGNAKVHAAAHPHSYLHDKFN